MFPNKSPYILSVHGQLSAAERGNLIVASGHAAYDSEFPE